MTVMKRLSISKAFSQGAWVLGVAGCVAAAVIASLAPWVQRATAQTANRPPYKAPRTPDGRPNLNGLWQTLTPASWDIQDHAAKSGAVVSMGALGAIPAGV